jgi:hemerythrin-like domain-containing protein
MKNKPVKRSPYLKELSKDHHFGLLFCWKIKEGIKRNVAPVRMLNYIDFFWNEHLKAHFLEEDTFVFSRIDDPLCEQAKSEHQLIAAHVRGINETEEPEMEMYIHLTELLTAHIRFEERVLFPHLETILGEEELTAIGEQLAAKHSEPFNDLYADEFWTDKGDAGQPG